VTARHDDDRIQRSPPKATTNLKMPDLRGYLRRNNRSDRLWSSQEI